MRDLKFDIESEAFKNFRFDFNMILRDLVKNMMANNHRSGAISCRVNIEIDDATDTMTGETYLEPTVKFKTESTIQRKISAESNIPGQLQMLETNYGWTIVERESAQKKMEGFE